MSGEEQASRLIIALEARTKEFERGLKNAQSETEKRMAAIEKRTQAMSRKMQIGMAATFASFSVANAGKEALAFAGDYEAAMGRVQIALQASADDMRALDAAARDMGRSPLGVTAREAAAGFEILAKNGLATKDILNGAATASLTMAKALGSDLGKAADLATSVMLQFKRQANDLPSIADKIVGAANASKFSFEEIADAIYNSGGVAAAAGLDFNELLAAIAALSSQFKSGAEAGTALKTLLLNLAPTSKEAQAEIQKLGLSFYDAQNQLKPLPAIAQELSRGMAGLSEQAKSVSFKTVFGSEGIIGAVALAGQGAAGINKLAAAIGNVSAQAQAEARMKGLNGALLALNAAWEDLLLTAANSGGMDTATAAVNRLVGAVGYLATNFDEIYPWIERVAGALAGLLVARGFNAAYASALATGEAILNLRKNIGTAATAWRAFGLASAALGGPLAIVVALAGVTFMQMRQGAKSAAERLDDIGRAAAQVETAYNKVLDLDQQIARDRADLKKASDDYAAAMRTEGEAAQTAAAMEIDAINTRIKGREALRAAYVDEARLEADKAKRDMEGLKRQAEGPARDVLYWREMGKDTTVRNFDFSKRGDLVEATRVEALSEARAAMAKGSATEAQREFVAANAAMEKAKALYEDLTAKAAALEKPLKKAESVKLGGGAPPPPKPTGGGGGGGGGADGRGHTHTAADEMRELSAEIAASAREAAELKRVMDAAVVSSGEEGRKTVEALMLEADVRTRIAQARDKAQIPEGSTAKEAQAIRDLAAAAERARIQNELMREGIKDRQKDIEDGIEADKKTAEEKAAADKKRDEAAASLQAEIAAGHEAAATQERLAAAAAQSEEAYADLKAKIDAEAEAQKALDKAKEDGVIITEELTLRALASAEARIEGEQRVQKATEERQKAEKRAEALKAFEAEIAANQNAVEAQERLAAAAAQSEEAYADLKSKLDAQAESQKTLDKLREADVAITEEMTARALASAEARAEGERRVQKATEERQKAEKRAEALKAFEAEIDANQKAVAVQERLAAAATQSEEAYNDLKAKLDAEAEAQKALAKLKEAEVAITDDMTTRALASAEARADGERRVQKAIEDRQEAEKRDKDAMKALLDLARETEKIRFESSLTGLPPEARRKVIDARAEAAAQEKLRGIGAPEDAGAPLAGKTVGAVKADLTAAERDRLMAEQDKQNREDALKLLEERAKAEEKINLQIREAQALQPALAQLIRDRALAQGDAAAAAQAEAEAQRIVTQEVRQLELAKQGLDEIAKAAGDGLAKAFEDAVFGAKSAKDAVRELGLEIAKLAFQKAVTKPLGDALGGMFGNLFGGLFGVKAANGMAFGAGGVPITAYAKGGIVNMPTPFAHAGGLGLMGEAGPEAIVPLRRGRDGKLGVSMQGGRGPAPAPHVTIHISTPDVEGFRRSQSQISAAIARAANQGRRYL